MFDNFIHLHQHDVMSNGGGYMEVISSMDDYLEYAVEHNIPAIAISNHGNVVDWMKRKLSADKKGIKYVHAIEAYVTQDNDKTDPKNRTRDNWHVLLIAKNYDGVKEINMLSSNSFDRSSNHYYFKPRMYADEIFATSDNIIVLSACLGSPIYQSYKNNDKDNLDKWIKFFSENRNRTYLELQPHLDDEQKVYNKLLISLSEKHGIPIVATNDVHAVSKRHDEVRKILKKSKGMDYENDDDYELFAKTRNQMVESFKEQGVLTEAQINTALDNTMSVVEQVEDFELERSHKYPKLFNKDEQRVGQIDVSCFRDKPFEDELDVFRHLIVEGYKIRGIDKLSQEKQVEYKARVNHELRTYIQTGSIGYMLLEWMVKKDGREKRINPDKEIFPAYGRGSVSGSLIGYLLQITEMDSVKENLNFERFMNEDRITLADIDSDFGEEDRYSVMSYLLKHPDLYCASIVTKNTYATLKSAIRAIGKGVGYTSHELDVIAKQVDDDGNIPDSVKEEHSELISVASASLKTVASFGRHASGIVVSSEDIRETIGIMSLSNWDYPVTQSSMKEIDYINNVKLDILGLDNWELVERASNLAGLPRLTPDSVDIIDFQDERIWNEMTKSNLGIFQFESDRAGKLLSDMFSSETIARIREDNPDFKYLNLLSILSGGQRPSGASYIEDVVKGVTRKWGIKPLDDFLKDTLGVLIFQEQLTEFLVKFCGWTVSEGDIIRRGIGKKDHEIMNREVPKIKPSFIENMVNEHGQDRELVESVADDFIQVFLDSADYSFSLNHAQSYSYLGAISTFLRTYYPLEFCASALTVWSKGDKNVKILNYAENHGFKIKPARFRKSQGKFSTDKETGTIYSGTNNIKGGNASVGDTLYQLKDRDYPTFTDLVIDIIENSNITIDNENMSIQELYKSYDESQLKALEARMKKDDSIVYEKSPLGINKTKIEGLIKLNFFDEFGKAKKLMNVYEYVLKNYKPNNKTFSGKAIKYLDCLEYEASLEDEGFSIIEQCENELELTGRVTIKSETIPPKYAFVTDVVVKKTLTNATVYSINKGQYTQIKVGAKTYREAKFEAGDLIELQSLQVKAKRVQSDGVWVNSDTDKELWVKQLKFIRKSKVNMKDEE